MLGLVYRGGAAPIGLVQSYRACLGMFVGMLILMPLALFSGLPRNVFEPSNLSIS